MRVKISFLKSNLHDNVELEESSKVFLKEISRNLKAELISSDLSDYEADLKLIFIESGGSEGLFLSNFSKLKEPYYLLTSGHNNSLAASMEIMTYLNLHHLKGEILHGSTEFISNRINELVKLNYVKNELSKRRLGLIGNPSDWLISSIPDTKLLKEKLGIDLVKIEINELIKKFKEEESIDLAEVNKHSFDKNELDLASKMYVSIKDLIDEYKLDAFSIRCFDLLNTCKTTSCLALAKLNSEGVTSTCEGDVAMMISMEIIRLLLDEVSFQANPSLIDVKNREMILAHCTIPFKMLEDYNLDTHFESGIGVAIKGELRKEAITVFRISSDLKHYFVSEGEILENLNRSNLCRTQIKVKMDEDLSELLTKPCGNHHLVVYGRHKALIDSLMKYLGFSRVD